MVRTFLAAAAAVSLVSTPLAANAAPARTSAPVAGQSEELVGLLWQYLILPLIIAAVLAVVVGGDEDPASP